MAAVILIIARRARLLRSRHRPAIVQNVQASLIFVPTAACGCKHTLPFLAAKSHPQRAQHVQLRWGRAPSICACPLRLPSIFQFLHMGAMGMLCLCRDGCRVSLGFFNDVVIPDYSLQNPSYFRDTERVWYWQYGDDQLPMDPGAQVRFRVSSIRFNPMPTAAEQAAAAAAAAPPAGAAAGGAAAAAAAAAPVVYSPMEIMGEMDADGLGLTEWWLPAQEEEGAVDEADLDAEMAPAADGEA